MGFVRTRVSVDRKLAFLLTLFDEVVYDVIYLEVVWLYEWAIRRTLIVTFNHKQSKIGSRIWHT